MHYRYLLNLLTIVGLALSLIVASPATPAWALGTTVSADGSPDLFPDVAEASDGRLTAAWVTELGAPDRQVRVATSTNGGTSWSGEITLFDGDPNQELDNIRTVYDTQNNLHLIFRYGLDPNRRILYRYLPAGADPTVLGNWQNGTTACSNCPTADLVAGADGYVYVLYESPSNFIGIRRTSGASGAWSAEQRVQIGGRVRGALAVTPDSKIHVIIQRVASPGGYSYARYTSFDNFTRETLDDLGSTSASEPPDIASDSSGRVHMVYELNDELFYRQYDGSLSGATQVSQAGAGRKDPTIGAASSGNVYVAWTQNDRKSLYEAQRINGVWSGPAKLAGSEPTARYQQYGKSLRGSVNLVFVEGGATKFLNRVPGGPITYTVNDGHIALGAAAPALSWYFAEGYTGTGFDEFIAIVNPNSSTANITITYYLAGGGTVPKSFTIPGQQRRQIAVHETTYGVGRGQAVSSRVQSDVPIVAERSMYFRYGPSAIDGGHTGIGATSNTQSTWYFAEGYTGPGFDEFITIQNPGAETSAAITYYVEGSGATLPKNVILPANSRTTVGVHDANDPGGYGRTNPGQGISAKVSTSGQGIIVERPMYFTYAGNRDGGHNVIGANSPSTIWYFAEGYTGSGFDEFITIQNPNGGPANVTITYYLEGSSTPAPRSLIVPANSRETVQVHNEADAGGYGRTNPGQGISAKVESDQPVIAERPMYFNYGASVDGGHNVMGATAAGRSWYFPVGETKAGFDEFITIQNPTGTDGTATLTYYFDDGTLPETRMVALLANSRITVQSHVAESPSNPGGIGRRTGGNSVHVATTVDTVVERPMYFNYSSTFAN